MKGPHDVTLTDYVHHRAFVVGVHRTSGESGDQKVSVLAALPTGSNTRQPLDTLHIFLARGWILVLQLTV